MCGICGVWELDGATPADELRSATEAMTRTLAHRGPDDEACWIDARSGVGLGHRRLSVLDLSRAGRQPMTSSCGRFVLSYNGELYNHLDLCEALAVAGRKVDPTSDTRVLVEACAAWGVRDTLARLRGMFALAVWDRREALLHLARDRVGIKPLYWCRAGRRILFGSELEALRAHPAWAGAIDRDSLAAYLRFAYVPAPRSIYREVHKLQPGHWMSIDAAGRERTEAYWSLRDVMRRGNDLRSRRLDPQAAIDRFDELLRDAVRRHMISDVPLGAFLSGGVDSSTVVALMQSVSSTPVRTFTIGSADPRYDESGFARDVAHRLGTDHTEMLVDAEQVRETIPRLPSIHDEPFADLASLPTFLLSELTRRHVKVALSGDGGDELFVGYHRYHAGRRLGRVLQVVPRALRRGVAAALRILPPGRWDALLGRLGVGDGLRGDRVHKLAGVLGARDPDELYRRAVSAWNDPASVVRGGREPATALDDPSLTADLPDLVERMAYLDTLTYLPDGILTKLDRASMAVGLEARVPFLDHEVVRFAWELPLEWKYRGGRGKWIVRRVLERYLPGKRIERPKRGFGIPLDAWLRGPLRDWADDLLAEDAMRAEDYLDPEPIRRAWAEHRSGRRNHQASLWTVLMFQQWLRRPSAR